MARATISVTPDLKDKWKEWCRLRIQNRWVGNVAVFAYMQLDEDERIQASQEYQAWESWGGHHPDDARAFRPKGTKPRSPEPPRRRKFGEG